MPLPEPSSTRLLSLPDEVLTNIASHLIPLPPSTTPTTTTLTHALSLSQTCQKLHAIVTPRLHTLDFLSPGSYNTFTARIPPHVSTHLHKFIASAAPYLQALQLPPRFRPTDEAYSVVAQCHQLTHLSLSIEPRLSTRWPTFFAHLPHLRSITLDHPSADSLTALAHSRLSLTSVTFVNFPACTESFQRLAFFLASNAGALQSLAINLICPMSSYNQPHHSLQPDRALRRLSSILQQRMPHLSNLRVLQVGTIPHLHWEGPFDTYHASGLYRKILHFQQAVKNARLAHPPHTNTLERLTVRVESESINACIAFMSPWIHPQLELEVSFPDLTLVFPPCPDPGAELPRVTELLLWFDPCSVRNAIWNVDLDLETLGVGSKIAVTSCDDSYRSQVTLEDLIRAKHLKTLRFLFAMPNVAVFNSTMKFFAQVSRLAPTLTTLELPADALILYATAEGKDAWVSAARPSIKVIRIYDFQDGDMNMLDKPSGPWALPVRHIALNVVHDKARWFLKGLPVFLDMLMRVCPALELVYMEQTGVQAEFDPTQIYIAVSAVESFENAQGVDASTLKTEIMEWRYKEAPES